MRGGDAVAIGGIGIFVTHQEGHRMVADSPFRFIVLLPPYRFLPLCLFSLIALAAPARAQFGPDQPPQRGQIPPEDKAGLAAKTAYEENLAKYKGQADFLVLPGLLADRKAKQVRLWAKATSVGYGDPIEFFLIPPDSGKDYEAMFVAFVRPSDVHRAMEFVGMKGGRAVDPSLNQYWPKGERVCMTVEWEQPPAAGQTSKPAPQRARIEELLVNVQTQKAFPPTGLVFTGSYWIKAQEQGKKDRYAADVFDPRSIASNHNCPPTVFDVPRQAVKGEVYGLQKLNPDYRFVPDQPVRVLLEPEHKDGRLRLRDLSLIVSIPAGKDDAGLASARFVLADPQGRQLNEAHSLVYTLAAFNKIIEARQDPFVTVCVDDRMTLATVRELYKLLMSIDCEDGIRVEPPPRGHLYYRAFFPNEEWRDRATRLGRPWELHVQQKNGAWMTTLILPADDIDNNRGMGDLTFNVKTPAELAKVLVEKSDRWSQTVYVFAPPHMAYGSLMSLLRPAMKTHPTMYVFPPK